MRGCNLQREPKSTDPPELAEARFLLPPTEIRIYDSRNQPTYTGLRYSFKYIPATAILKPWTSFTSIQLKMARASLSRASLWKRCASCKSSWSIRWRPRRPVHICSDDDWFIVTGHAKLKKKCHPRLAKENTSTCQEESAARLMKMLHSFCLVFISSSDGAVAFYMLV